MELDFDLASWDVGQSFDDLSTKLFAPYPALVAATDSAHDAESKKKKKTLKKKKNGVKKGQSQNGETIPLVGKKLNSGEMEGSSKPTNSKLLPRNESGQNDRKKRAKTKVETQVESSEESAKPIQKQRQKLFPADGGVTKRNGNKKKAKRLKKVLSNIAAGENAGLTEKNYTINIEKKKMNEIITKPEGGQNEEHRSSKKRKKRKCKNKYADIAADKQKAKLKFFGLEVASPENNLQVQCHTSKVVLAENGSEKNKMINIVVKNLEEEREGQARKKKKEESEEKMCVTVVKNCEEAPARKRKKKEQREGKIGDTVKNVEEEKDIQARKRKKKELREGKMCDIVTQNYEGKKEIQAKKRMKTQESEKKTHVTDISHFNVEKLKKYLFLKKTVGDSEEHCDKKKDTGSSPGKNKSPEDKVKAVDGSKALRERMMEKLKSARFRYLNEKMYTTTGEESFRMMNSDPESFQVYHEGFQAQVCKWKQNPVDLMITYIRCRSPDIIVADFGCGDARLAESVPNKVHSFDLLAINERVTACNMAHVPLSSQSVDIAVFCLALMGTDIRDFLCEGNRVLKDGATLLIAEVISRFEKVGVFVRKMAKLGFTLRKKDDSNKMFVWFEFKKTGSPDRNKLPQIDLAPCLYKKR